MGLWAWVPTVRKRVAIGPRGGDTLGTTSPEPDRDIGRAGVGSTGHATERSSPRLRPGKWRRLANQRLASAAPLHPFTTMTLPPRSPQTTAAPDIAGALGRIPSGLFVAAWRDGELDRAMLASWVMQAGFTPPSVSVAVAPSRDLLAAIDRGGAFAVSVLAESQRPLLARFGKPTADPFTGLDVERTPAGLAVLAGAAAWLECRPSARVAHGDHVVVVADVIAGGGTAGDPLVHVRKNGLRY